MLMFLLVATSIGVALSNPFARPNNDNIPQCAQPPASGMCLAYFPSYYYNPSTKTCESFIYGGCQGNSNRFFSFDDCMAKCGDYKQETNDFKLILENGEEQSPSASEPQVEENVCSLSSEMGPCRASFPRFYFAGDKCEEFIYGGCEGNGNNFKSVEECQQRCGSTSSEEAEADSEEATEKASEETSAEQASEENSETSDDKTEN